MWHLSNNNNYFFNADQPRDTLFNTSVPAACREIGMFVYVQC